MNQVNNEIQTVTINLPQTERATLPTTRKLYEKPRLEIHEGYKVLVAGGGSI
jgi:hypothetical protein